MEICGPNDCASTKVVLLFEQDRAADHIFHTYFDARIHNQQLLTNISLHPFIYLSVDLSYLIEGYDVGRISLTVRFDIYTFMCIPI